MRIQGEFSVEDKAVAEIMKNIQQIVERTVTAQFEKLKGELCRKTEPPTPSPSARPTGVDLPEVERLKAADLRTALLLGKIPKDSGLLIDGKAAAKLLGVSYQTVRRLHQMKAFPEPVKLGTLVRWRLTELIEWLDDGCPSHWQWPQPRKNRR